MKKQILLAVSLLMTMSAFASWIPGEKYANWVSHFKVDQTWKFENSSHGWDVGGSVHQGVSMVDFPNTIAWAFMSWDERCSNSDDHNMDWFELWLRNSNNGAELQIVRIVISHGDNDYWPQSIDNRNDNKTYYGQARWYDYADGAWFCYMVTEYSDKTREFIKNAGNSLQVEVRTRWDDNHWNNYTKYTQVNNSDRQFLSVPSKPSVNNVEWTVHDAKTAVKYTRSVPSGCTFRLREKYHNSTVFEATSSNTNTSVTDYTYPFQQSKKPNADEMYGTPLSYECYSDKKYTMNQANYSTSFGLPKKERTFSSAVTTFTPPCFTQAQNFICKDNNDGTIQLNWSAKSCTGSSKDESNFVIERATDKDFTQDIKKYEESYNNSQQNYKRSIEFTERELDKQTFYFRIYRKDAAPNDAILTSKGQVEVNTNYAKLSKFEGEINDNNHPVLHWHIDAGVCTPNMQLKLKFSTLEKTFDLAEAIQMSEYEVTDALPTCENISFTAQIVENATMRGKEWQFQLLIPNTTAGYIESYSVSKGFYNDRVQLRWKIDHDKTNFSFFQVSREELGTVNQMVPLGTIDFKPGVLDYAFEDVNCVPGVYYQYHIIGSTKCNDVTSVIHQVSSVGFAQPYGVVSGQITYSGNQGVPDVSVSVIGEDVRRNRSLRFIGKNNSYLAIPDSLIRTMVGEQGTIEFYMRDDNANGDRHVILGSYEIDSWAFAVPTLYCNHNKLELMTQTPLGVLTDLEIEVIDTVADYSRFNHIALTYNNQRLVVYVNGQQVAEHNMNNLFHNGFMFGSDGFDGFVDEIRVWNICRSQEEIQRTMNVYLNGKEPGLTGYYRCDDEIESELFDISRTGTMFNERHLKMYGIVPDKDNIPTSEQLSLKTYTDKDGNYLINNVPFTSDGSLYKVIPTLGVHEFSPASRPLFFSRDASTHNSIDFTDKSSFEVTGKVTFENTDYPVKGCQFYVDGQICANDGTPVETDADGNFSIQVPIGEHSIVVKKDGHIFVNEGRYPADPAKTGVKAKFVEPRNNLCFYDATTVLVVGRVAGGDDEQAKVHGFGLGKANLGQATIVLCPPEDTYNLNLSTDSVRSFIVPDSVICNSTAFVKKVNGGDAHSVTIKTDAITGEFAVALPPIDFEIKEIKIPNNPAIVYDLGKYENLTLGSSNIHQTTTDTLRLDSVNYKTVTYLQKLDAIHFALPELTISQWGSPDGSLGEKTYYVSLPSGEADTVALYSIVNGKPEYTFGSPCYLQDKTYSWTISAFETYINYDNPQHPDTTHRAMRDAIVTIENELGEKEVAEEDGYIIGEKGDSMQVVAGQVISLDQNQVLLDSAGTAQYLFTVGQPNVVTPYTYNVNISFSDAQQTRTYTWSENGKCKGIIFGARTSGTNFVTEGPDKLLFVLRDPPGGQSTATWKSGESIISTTMTSREFNRGHEGTIVHYCGLEAEVGTGIGIVIQNKTEATADIEVGVRADGTTTWNTTESFEVTTTKTISTAAGSPYVGTTGDVYVGAGTNVLFGNAREVTLEKIQNNPPRYQIIVEDVISTGSVFKTTFNYTTFDIETWVIPNYIKQRNALLKYVDPASYNANYPNYTPDPIYITTLTESDPRFGSDNHDKDIWKSAATPIDSLGGPSYIMIPPQTLVDTVAGCIDRVCHFNNQIRRWQRVLANNEEMKVLVHHSTQKFDQKKWDDACDKVAEALRWRAKLRDPNETSCRNYDNTQVCSHKYLEEDYANSGVDTSLVEVRDYYSGGWLIDNISLGGGATVSSSSMQTTGNGGGTTFVDGFKGLLKSRTGAKINGFGFDWKTDSYAGYNKTRGNNTTKTQSSTIEYALATNNYEYMSVDVYSAPDGFGPIFATRGGQTYCPYEGEERTKYYEPGEHEIHTATVSMEEPEIRVEQPTVTDVPIGGKALYTITLANTADINADYFTWLKLYAAGDFNKNGAQISVDGAYLTDAGRLLKFYPSTPVIKTLVITQADYGTLDYDSVAIVLASDCSALQFADTIWLSAHFVPTCSPINLKIDNTTINTSTGDTLALTIDGYDRNFKNMKGIRLQYRNAADNDWHLIREFCIDAADTVGGQKTLITGPAIYYSLAMNDTQYPDGEYQFRAVTACTYGTEEIPNESDIASIVKDMQRPVSLGLPSPFNSIYTSDNQIYVDINEPIQVGRIKDKNISVKGVLNSHPVDDHSVALLLSDVMASSDADFNFSGTDFTIEFWYNYSSDGMVLAHAYGTQIGMILVVTEGNFIVMIGNYVAKSKEFIPQGKWCYITLEYVANPTGAGTFTAHCAYDEHELLLFDHVSAPKYDIRGNLLLGGAGICKMHDFALWNINRDWRTSLSERDKRKDAYTDGLLSYWPMDDGEGQIVRDIVRSRNLQVPATNPWWYNNNNIALTIPAGQVAKMDLSECPIAADEDYVFECWFRMQDDGTLFVLSDSVTTDSGKRVPKMSVGFWGKNLQFTVEGNIWNLATPIDVADGSWHHFALNSLHNTLPIFMLDGKTLDVVGLNDVPAFASSSVIFSSPNSTSELDLDEVRLWKACMMPQNTLLTMRSELRGDENGLIAYYPMEKDTVDGAMQPQKILSLEDRVSKHSITCEAGKMAEVVPALRKERSVEVVKHTFTPSAQRIVINLSEPAARIEGCTLEFEVTDLIDEHGNYSNPISWTAFVNRNQLLWSDAALHVSKAALLDTTIMITIENKSGKVENWSIYNAPEWLVFSESSGVIQPLQKKQIECTILGSLAIGNYEQTIYLIGNESVMNPLRLTVRVNAEKPNWSINPADFEYSMNMISTATISAEYADDSEDVLAAFIDGQLVGLASPQLFSAYNRHYIMMDIYANLSQADMDSISRGVTPAKEVTFKYWDASTGRIYTDVRVSIPQPDGSILSKLYFVNGQLVGSLISPVRLKAGTSTEQTLSLSRGWNWVSFNVVPNNVRFNSILQDIIKNTTIIKSQTEFAQISAAGDSLQGTLKVMDCKNGYKLQVDEPCPMSLTGSVVNPTITAIPLRGNGSWNWISYLPQMSLDVNTALSNITPAEGDIIKARSGFAMWDGYQWVGSLKLMSAGNAYLYYSLDEDMILYYPSLLRTNAPAKEPMLVTQASAFPEPVDPASYSGNMTITAVVKDGDQVLTDAEVAIFAGDECRSVAFSDDGLWYLTVPGDKAVSLTIKVATANDMVVSNQKLTYIEDAIVGTCAEPYVIQLNEATSLRGVQMDSTDNKVEKYIENGIVYIKRNGQIYTAQGALVRK